MTMLAIIGDSEARLWGLHGAERLRRIALAQKLTLAPPGEATLLANAAFAFDPLWLKHLAMLPGTMLTQGDVPVVAHVADPAQGVEIAAAMVADRATDLALVAIRSEDRPELVNGSLRKRERAFVDRLTPATVRPLQEASYAGSYKGVTDLLTKYLWPRWAFHLTRLAAWTGLSPNMVTTIGFACCIAATLLFWHGDYWTGMAAGLGLMVLDTVDGKLARCTITSSRWGNIFDHGIDLIHPPFWWAAWLAGLARYGRPLDEGTMAWTLGIILGGYVLQRLIEGVFMRMFGGIHIHVWRRIDSRFRLITARRNPNMVILFASMLVARPDWGIVAVAGWTAISLLVHAVQFAQALGHRARGERVVSWLA